jgi:predicted SAM-dependent methyltransferase
MKLNLGSGQLRLEGYINVDLFDPTADLKCDIRKLPFDDCTVDEIIASHVIEHFDHMEAFSVLAEWKRVLKVGGTLIIETPELLGTMRKFLAADERLRCDMYGHIFSTPWIDGQWHKFIYTPQQLDFTLRRMGFVNIHQVPALRYIGLEDVNLKMICQRGAV